MNAPGRLVGVSPVAAEKRGTSPEAGLRRSLFRMLAWLDDRRPTGLVKVRAGTQDVGRLVVARGRLCLAYRPPGSPAADPQAAPQWTTDDADGRRDLLDLAREARLRGATLSATLGRSAPVERLREALLEETAHELAAIVEAYGADEPILKALPARDDYDDRLVLGHAEVFTATLRTLFAVPASITREMLEAVGENGTALLLVRSNDAGEQPFPVAQAGFKVTPLREFLDTVRLASEIGRLVEHPRARPKTMIATFGYRGERWRTVAGPTRTVLLKTAPERLEAATAWAHLCVSSES